MHPVITVLELGPRPLPIGSYGVLLALALALGTVLTLRAATRAGMDGGAVVAVLGCTVAGGFVGGWALHLVVQAARLESWGEALQRPGLAFFGAGLGGLLALAVSARALAVPALALLDRAVVAVALSHAVGRVGCLLGGCCHGAPTTGWVGVRYDHPLAPASSLGLPLHPVPLYEASGLLLLALAFGLRVGVDERRPGRRMLTYVACYSLLRLALEGLRGDRVRGLWLAAGLSTSQLIALSLLAACALLWPLVGTARPNARRLA